MLNGRKKRYNTLPYDVMKRNKEIFDMCFYSFEQNLKL